MRTVFLDTVGLIATFGQPDFTYFFDENRNDRTGLDKPIEICSCHDSAISGKILIGGYLPALVKGNPS